jgi:hypothetical protein
MRCSTSARMQFAPLPLVWSWCRVAFAVSADNPSVISTLRARCHFYLAPTFVCKRNIEMTPLCKIEVTHPRVLGSREVRRGGVVDEQAGVQPS